MHTDKLDEIKRAFIDATEPTQDKQRISVGGNRNVVVGRDYSVVQTVAPTDCTAAQKARLRAKVFEAAQICGVNPRSIWAELNHFVGVHTYHDLDPRDYEIATVFLAGMRSAKKACKRCCPALRSKHELNKST